MTKVTRINADWFRAYPLAAPRSSTDKNERGRVLVVGGSKFVPGAIRLTGEAALRVGAGKLQQATVKAVAMSVGVLVPEAAMIALPHDRDGEIAVSAVKKLQQAVTHCDTLILGPGMTTGEGVAKLLNDLLECVTTDQTVVLDAGCLHRAREAHAKIRRSPASIIMTPHYGEMAAITDLSISEIVKDPVRIALTCAEHYNSTVILKAARTVIASCDGLNFDYESECPGLATRGSGDVLAGIVDGFAARGGTAIKASTRGVWLHGEAGKSVAAKIGPVGFLARELPVELPKLLEMLK